MRESGELMEFGIFNFPMCFQGLLVKGVMRQRGTSDAVFESVPMLDVEKQRKLIFDKYESQCAYSVDITLNELAGLLNCEKTPTKGILTSYVNKMKELKKGTCVIG